MNSAHPPPQQPPPAAITPPELMQQQLHMLAEIAAMGMSLLRVTTQAALELPTPPPAHRPTITHGDPALTFARLSRVVRQTIALQTRVMEGPRQRPTERQRRQQGADARQKLRVRDAIEQAIAADQTGRDREQLLAELDEKLDDPDVCAELARTPIGLFVVGLCQDFGLPINPNIWSDAELGAGNPEWDPRVSSPASAPPSPQASSNGRWHHTPSQDYRPQGHTTADIDPCPD